jgi:hypothetical protein
MCRRVVSGEPDVLFIISLICRSVVFGEADVAGMVNQVAGERAGRMEDNEAARADKAAALEVAEAKMQAALRSAKAEKQAELESAHADNDAALNTVKTAMTAQKESHEEDMASLRAQLATFTVAQLDVEYEEDVNSPEETVMRQEVPSVSHATGSSSVQQLRILLDGYAGVASGTVCDVISVDDNHARMASGKKAPLISEGKVWEWVTRAPRMSGWR